MYIVNAYIDEKSISLKDIGKCILNELKCNVRFILYVFVKEDWIFKHAGK